MGFLDQLTGLTRGDNASVAENPKLLPGGPTNFFQLFSRIPITPTVPEDFGGSSRVHSTAEAAQTGAQAGSPKQSFWSQIKEGSSPLGSTIQSLLGTLALGGLGAGIGAIASPGARGLGAARGFGVGAVKGIDQDIGMRKSAAQMPQNLLDDQLKQMQLKQAQANLDPQSHREFMLAAQDPAYAEFLKQKQVNPLGLENLLLKKQQFDLTKEFKGQIPAGQAMTLGEGENVPSIISGLRETINTNKDIFGPIEGRIRSYIPYDTQSQDVNSQIFSAKQLIGKFMEGGVLRKEDEAKYEKMLPSMADTYQVALKKADNLEKFLNDRYNAYLKSLGSAKYNVSGYKQLGQENKQVTPQFSIEDIDAEIARRQRGK